MYGILLLNTFYICRIDIILDIGAQINLCFFMLYQWKIPPVKLPGPLERCSCHDQYTILTLDNLFNILFFATPHLMKPKKYAKRSMTNMKAIAIPAPSKPAPAG